MQGDLEPREWAVLQYNLGNAYLTQTEGEPEVNLTRAIEAYQAALPVFEEYGPPLDWARTQYNLGSAYLAMPNGHAGQALNEAIECYKAALEVLGAEGDPLEAARAYYNLGYAQLQLADQQPSMLTAAVANLAEASARFDPAATPLEYARCQNNLGAAYARQIEQGGADLVARAVSAYEAGLAVLDRSHSPHDWALLGSNLAQALLATEGAGREPALREAVTLLEDALEIWSPTLDRGDWTRAMIALGNAYRDLPGDASANRSRAIECYEAALKAASASAV